MTASDPSRLIASLARDRVTLDLKTVDLCFLAGLYLRADKAALASFEEDVLVDMFEQVCDVVEPGAENPRKRATHAIQRLRDQRMLARIDGAGIVRAGEYALTTLAAAVVEYFLADEALTRESLTLLTGILRAQLAEILAAAKRAQGDESWRSTVSGPLAVTVADLVGGIERRQRGLDAQQEEVQVEIAKLLSADWFRAVERCQVLLDATTGTLRELNEILLRDTHHFVALLQEIQALASAAGNTDAEATAQRVIEHVDRIAAWGSGRQRAWSEYYQYVHRYLRDVVRLDPDRALSQRLRDQLAGWPTHPFYVLIARAPSIRLLRQLEARVDRPPVARPRTDREAEPAWVDSENMLADIEALVARALDEGSQSLAEVTSRVLPQLPTSTRYAAAGRVADAMARRVRVRSAHERPWARILETLEIEDWTVDQGDRFVSDSTFHSLEAAIADQNFPEIDLMLRRGRHIGRDDGMAYDFLVDAQALLEGFYRRFGCELVQQTDGYFFLLPSSDRLGRRQLSAGEMLVGQTLALLYLDPATLQHGGLVDREALLERLSGLLGTDVLVRTLSPRKRKYDERIAAETVRTQVGEALRRLADLGFIDVMDEARLRLRPALMRFAEPIRGLGDPNAALERLIARGEVVLGETPGADEADDEATGDEEPLP